MTQSRDVQLAASSKLFPVENPLLNFFPIWGRLKQLIYGRLFRTSLLALPRFSALVLEHRELPRTSSVAPISVAVRRWDALKSSKQFTHHKTDIFVLLLGSFSRKKSPTRHCRVSLGARRALAGNGDLCEGNQISNRRGAARSLCCRLLGITVSGNSVGKSTGSAMIYDDFEM